MKWEIWKIKVTETDLASITAGCYEFSADLVLISLSQGCHLQCNLVNLKCNTEYYSCPRKTGNDHAFNAIVNHGWSMAGGPKPLLLIG